jgi:hypothetical protein
VIFKITPRPRRQLAEERGEKKYEIHMCDQREKS